MIKNLRKAALILIFLAAASGLSAKTETAVLHLRASVAAKTEVSVNDDLISVSSNTEDLSFIAYDAHGSLLSYSSAFTSHEKDVKLCFSAV